MGILIRTGLMVLAVWVTFAVVDGLSFDGDWLGLVIVALIIGVANAVVIPLLKLISLPVRIVTLGLFTLVINIAVLLGVIVLADILDLGVSSTGFVPTLIGALLLTVFSSIISMIAKD
ncbi:MAG: phage holin family protein [Acidimicrobiia bacterium]